jgi:hypothetical protein
MSGIPRKAAIEIGIEIEIEMALGHERKVQNEK